MLGDGSQARPFEHKVLKAIEEIIEGGQKNKRETNMKKEENNLENETNVKEENNLKTKKTNIKKKKQ